jgi:DNA-binding transcriptional MerR regulator
VSGVAWSTRQLAELAGTSVRAVRHYHDVGLLPEPERRSNGYKQYGVSHLVRLLRVKRLSDLGFSLPQIAEMGEADEHPEEALRTLDAELAATIERLQRARVELAVLLRRSAPTDLPPEIAPAAAQANLSHADRSLIVVLSRVLDSSVLEAYGDMLRSYEPGEVGPEFDGLAADADEATRQDLAERLAPRAREIRAALPGTAEAGYAAPGGAPAAARAIGTALRELYTPAQIDVIVRIERLLDEKR